MTKKAFILLAVFTSACAPSASGTPPITQPTDASATQISSVAIAVSESTAIAATLLASETTLVDLEDLDVDYGRYTDYEIEASVALESQWQEISRAILDQGLTLPSNIRVVDISAGNALIEALQTGREDDYPEGTTFTISFVKGREGELLTVTLNGANDIFYADHPTVELAISIDELPAALNSAGIAIAFVDRETGQWVKGSISLAPEVIENVEQATTTPKEEAFAEPTLDNVEFHERWNRNQFPLEGNLADGPLRYYFDCITDEIITVKAEIMGPNGEGTGIYLMVGAECWYSEPNQDYAVLTPLVITDHQQIIIAGYAIRDYSPVFEGGNEEEWNGLLESRGFIGRGHIFAVTITVPRNDGGSNQGLGNEELGAVYTQELVEQFASGNGDPSMLPFVIIDGIKYYVLPPFEIGMRNTLNRVGENPYAQE